jgi:flagellar assembly protein FliH
MQESRPVKFKFDNVFGSNGAPAQQSTHARSSYSSEEVESIRKETFAQGKTDAEARSSAARAAAIGAIAQAMLRMLGEVDKAVLSSREESAEVVLHIARKIAGAALDAFPLKEVEALVGECLDKLHREPRIVVRVAEAVVEQLRADIDAMCEQHGFTGRVVVLDEKTLSGADCRIEWADGGIERDLTQIQAAIDEAAERWRASLSNKEV